IYYQCNRVIPYLKQGKEEKDKYGNKTTTGDYLVDEKSRTAVLTEEGVSRAEKLLKVDNLYDLNNIDLLHGSEQALRAHTLYKKDVVVIPTNVPMIRGDHQDVVYASESEKYEAVAEEIAALREKGQPVLVGTVSIEKSEHLSGMLKARKIPHVVLNAKFHEKEAEIVAQAGKSGSVTIATNMAGRGTDIVLGGNPEAFAEQRRKEVESEEQFGRLLAELKAAAAKDREKVLVAGGLFIVGTERHESRRV